jgi:hypothetical protein
VPSPPLRPLPADRGTVRWNLAWSALLLVIALAAVAIQYAGPVRDGDLFFHLAYGRYFLEHHTLIPDHTAFSWTPTDGSTQYCAWIPEIFFYLVHQAGGLTPLFAFTYLCILILVASVLWLAWRMQVIRHPLVGFLALLGALMSDSAAYSKPEIFSYVFMVAVTALWFRIKTGGEMAWRWGYLFPVVMLLWINSHGGFIFGAFFLGLMFAGETLNRYASPSQALPARVWRHLLYALLLSGLTVFITPYFWKYPLHLANLAGGGVEDWRMVRAYLSIFDPRVRHLFYAPYFAIVALIFLLLLWRRVSLKRIDWALLLTNAGMAYVYTRYLRSTYYWVPVFAPSAVFLLARKQGPFWPRRPRWAPTALAAGIACCALLLASRAGYQSICRPTASRWCGFGISYQNPVEEAEFIRTHLAQYRLGNDYGGGGYLLWRLHPQTKVMIDPRSFPYRAWLARYQRFASGQEIPQFVADFPADVWCLSLAYERVTAWFLRQPDWKLAFYGPSAAVFVRAGIALPEMAERAGEGIARLASASQALYVFRFAMALGDWPVALRILARMQEHFPCPVARRQTAAMADLYAGTRAFYGEDYATAARHLEACRAGGVISDTNLLLNTYYRMTTTAWVRKDEPGAYDAARAALAVDPGDPVALFNAGVIGWYLEAQARGRTPGDQSQVSLNALPGRGGGAWPEHLRLFLDRTEGQPGNQSLRTIAARMLKGDYAGRPNLVVPGP